eukprot:4333402-Karenia_brevis.AAC.1
MNIYTDGSGGERSADPRPRRCGWAWTIKQYSPVAYYGEYGLMDGRQTVPRADMTAVIRALLH